MTRNKKGVEVVGKFIHPEIRAGENYTIFIYQPFFINNQLSPELEEYINKFNINLIYIKKPRTIRR